MARRPIRAAVELGRRGGKRRMAALSPRERRDLARRAAEARWRGVRDAERLGQRLRAFAGLQACSRLREAYWRGRGRWVEVCRRSLAARLSVSHLGVARVLGGGVPLG